MASVLESLRPLHALTEQAADPKALIGALIQLVGRGAEGSAVCRALAESVTDGSLARSTLVHAGVLNALGETSDDALIRLSQLQLLGEMLDADHWELILTVPEFLRSVENAIVERYGVGARRRQTRVAVGEIAAKASNRLFIAAPYLQNIYVSTLVPSVARVLELGGEVLVLTRALTSRAPERSWANVAAINQLRLGAAEFIDKLHISSWEEAGIGIHFKAVVADQMSAYLGSANLTQGGMGDHAEAGVLLKGSRVRELDRWLTAVATELDRRNELEQDEESGMTDE